jgi:hypothetical protein
MDDILSMVGMVLIVASIAVSAFAVGANTTFNRCLETNKHLAYVEARKVCGEELK